MKTFVFFGWQEAAVFNWLMDEHREAVREMQAAAISEAGDDPADDRGLSSESVERLADKIEEFVLDLCPLDQGDGVFASILGAQLNAVDYTRIKQLDDPELMAVYRDDRRERLRIEREHIERLRKSDRALSARCARRSGTRESGAAPRTSRSVTTGSARLPFRSRSGGAVFGSHGGLV